MTRTVKFEIFGLSFAAIAAALDFANHTDPHDWAAAQSWEKGTYVPFATHSLGGREWKLEAGAKPAFVADECFSRGGWFVLREEEVKELFTSSATSGSSLRARKGAKSWSLAIELPVFDGQIYRGSYAAAYAAALEARAA